MKQQNCLPFNDALMYETVSLLLYVFRNLWILCKLLPLLRLAQASIHYYTATLPRPTSVGHRPLAIWGTVPMFHSRAVLLAQLNVGALGTVLR